MNLSELRRAAQRYGVTINTNAPGDGIRRFEFASAEFGLLGRALGIAHAETWLRGFMAYADKVAGSEPRQNPRTPDFELDYATKRHLRRWLNQQRAHTEDEATYMQSQVEGFLGGLDKVDAEYLIDQGWPAVETAMEESGITFGE